MPTEYSYRIAVIPGDGIGVEVVPEGLKALETLSSRFDIAFDFEHFDWSCERYLATGAMMPDDGIEQLSRFDAIFLGAVGFPTVLDHGRLYEGTDNEMAMQQSIFTRKGTDRVLKYAFELARSRQAKRLTSATKSNGIIHTMPYWDERVVAMAENYPEIEVDKYHIDILVAHFVNRPEIFDVVVGSNLFGDILSDLGPGITGTIGIAPSANINPEGEFPSMFEPVHGSAPDIAGQGIANPIGQIWSAAMMLDHLGQRAAHDAVITAIEDVLRDRDSLTPDLGGSASCADCGSAIASRLAS
jgi:tartrate dehydrogenase/decarboxylase/D-malate dehydrogenase